MKLKYLCALLAVLPIAANFSAEPNKDYPTIDDTSYVEANGDRVIRLSVEVSALPEEVWRAFTTADGWKSFAVAFAQIDMKIGGIIETSYNPRSQAGDPDNIRNEIVAYVPGKMIAIRCVQAPRNFQHKQEFFSTATVFEIIPVDSRRTRILVTAVGYRPGEAYDDLFRKFRRGDAYTLDKLRIHFDKSQTTSDVKKQNEFPQQKKDSGKP